MVSVHIYPGELKDRFAKDTSTTYPELLKTCLEGARESHKPLFVGEFGPPPDNKEPWDRETAKAEGLSLLKAVEESGVPLAAIWVFDLSNQEKEISIRIGNHRAHYLEALRDANTRIQSSISGKP